MSISAICTVANMQAVNDALEEQGWGKNNFSIPAFTGIETTHAALHAWDDPAFLSALQAIPEVILNPDVDDPVIGTNDIIVAEGARWAAQAGELPSTGMVLAGEIYWHENVLWSIVQSFDRTTYPDHPETYPALMAMTRVPGVVTQWRQPLGSFDAYLLVEPFTQLPEQVYHNDKQWINNTTDNVWEPGTGALWLEVAP